MNIKKLSNRDFAELMIISGITSTAWPTMVEILNEKKESDRREILTFLSVNSEEVYNRLTSNSSSDLLKGLQEKIEELKPITGNIIELEEILVMREYKGPAGPSAEDTEHNTRVLMQGLKMELDSENVTEDWDYMSELLGESSIKELMVKIYHPRLCTEIFVSYDRWGFCIDSDNNWFEDIDQSDYITTLNAIKTWYWNNI